MLFRSLENEEKFVSPFRFAAVSRVEPSDDGFFAVVSFPDKAPAIIHLKRDGSFFEIYSSYRLALKPSQISVPRAISFPTGDGLEGHAWFYEPMSEAFEGILGEKPPLIVICHGGPTSSSPGEFRKMIQFWTSRGYSVVDVNYGEIGRAHV